MFQAIAIRLQQLGNHDLEFGYQLLDSVGLGRQPRNILAGRYPYARLGVPHRINH